MEPLLTRYSQLPIAEPRNPYTIVSQSPFSSCIQGTVLTTSFVKKDKFYPFLVCEPGDRWHYSPGLDWAGVMVRFFFPVWFMS
jgi:hypothetical protein